ncbi:hypothetical protein [Erythrobacter litoralis]|uniref:hypothetical protein n=1 Tax=Erythrobacter litoralis TaxID=39960 RepID=UPI002435D489|nr:hypothetical protein [Erythrobacter litoralis]
MAALGCFLLLLCPMVGAIVGAWLAGTHGMTIGAVAGLLVAVVACVVPGVALLKARRR